jgi:AsmA protein
LRKLLIGLGIFFVVVIVLAIIVPMVIPTAFYRDRLVAAVEASTGRALRISGPVKLSLLPGIAIQANDVGLANIPGGTAPEMATLAKLDIGISLLSLIGGDVEISHFVLTDPVIHLEVTQDGRENWKFRQPEQPEQPQSVPQPHPRRPWQLRADDVKLVNGAVDYRDARTGKRYAVSQIGATVALPDLDRKASADGTLTWRDKPVTLSLQADPARALFGEGTSTVKASVTSDALKLVFDGTVTGGKPPKLDGSLSLDTQSVRNLAAWIGSPPAIGGHGLGPFSLNGKISAVGPTLAFSDIALSLDAIKANGTLSVDTGGAVPAVKGALTVNMLDLNPYMARPAAAPSTAPASPGPPVAAPTAGPAVTSPAITSPTVTSPTVTSPAAAPPGPPVAAAAAPAGGAKNWSSAPIDLAALKSIDADLTVAADGVRYEELQVGKSALGITTQGGRLTVALTDIQLYGGNGKGQIVVDASAAVPAFAFNLAVSGIQAQPLLDAAIDLDRVTGTGQITLDVTTHGQSQRELAGALAGKGSFSFTNGAIKGIDLAAMAKNVPQAFVQAVASDTQQTAFSELGGSFTITNGVIRNDDLVLKSSVGQMNGTGTVDLPQRSLDYRVEPNVGVASQDIVVPILIKGPWDRPRFLPDVAGLLTKNAGKLIQGLGNGGSNAGSLLKGLLGK